MGTMAPGADYNLCIFATLLLLLSHSAVLVWGVKCYCTEKSCEEYGYCEAQWCVVGIRKSTGSVIRSCGTDSAYLLRICRRNLGDWQDLCACGENLCNSYAYLRTQIRHNRFLVTDSQAADKMPDYVQPHQSKVAQLVPAARTGTNSDAAPDTQPLQSVVEPQAPVPKHDQQSDNPAIVFTRVDQPKGGSRRQNVGGSRDRSRARDRHPDGSEVFERNSLLVILLVMVPLGIGAASVCIVASNYYCHLC